MLQDAEDKRFADLSHLKACVTGQMPGWTQCRRVKQLDIWQIRKTELDKFIYCLQCENSEIDTVCQICVAVTGSKVFPC